MIDLHAHTLHSDGERAPEALLAEAAQAGITVLAVTDHDTVAGIADSRRAADRLGIRLVAGIEISAEFHGREVHLLGHLLDSEARALTDLQRVFLEERRERMEQMVRRAQELGMKITLEQVVAQSGGENLGRPHLALALARAGYAEDVDDAFRRFLHDRAPLWIDRRRLPAAEAIALVHRAGGTASLAHPGTNRISEQELKVLAADGLDAVEALHPEHVPNQAEAYQRWASGLGLLVTAGSDFHGPRMQPGRKLAARTLDAERFAALEERARGWAARGVQGAQ